jgi:N-acetylmuramoyl-L-alanine amidase
VLAERLQDELTRLDLEDCRSHARAYPVLRETRMPAVLVEPGFISHPDDEKKLQDPDFLSQVSEAIALGVTRYFNEEL